MKSILTPILAFLLFQSHGMALQVTPGSTCAALCLDNPETDPLDPDSSNTRPDDIVCGDEEYESSSTGIKYKNCIDCLQQSNATSGTENDASWFLYNVRYSVDVCLYGFPNASRGISSPCDIDYGCAPLKKALETGILSPTGDQYAYCTADGGKFTPSQLDDCVQCFASSSNQEYMANFITALQAGCEQKPTPGTLLGLSGSLFTNSLVNITDPPVQETVEDRTDGSTAMTTGAIVGIAIGAALLFIGGVALFWAYHRKQKRLYGTLIGSDYDPRSGSQSVSPPMRGVSSSLENKAPLPSMSGYELRAQRAYTDNAEYYDALEKEIQIRRPNYAFDPNNPRSGRQGSLPTHFAYVPQAHSRQPSEDSSLQANKPVKSNKLDSYALEVYLNAITDANAGILPHTPPPAAAVRGPSPYYNSSSTRGSSDSQHPSLPSRQPSPGRNPSLHPNPQYPSMNSQSQASSLPPPPPQQPKVPSLILPSVPRIRIPKKYSPPNINIEAPTPVGESSTSQQQQQQHQKQQADLTIGVEISKPMVSHEPRFTESPWERRKKEPPPPLVIPQEAVDRRPGRWVVQESEVRTGSTGIYG
ncbi:hypothetical protein F5X99DRAFT_214311 [Biscogniauxia marginata]|nr:hypothetical protein F5X99DRAFT_214311 [Biscogniauxia marginata]